ncbi:hypothetical protein VHEMI03867 [[Torrubiella] hemipterigena]|uniref:Aminoglycoside phosphotransferase domain-containing protein n=1 Tax=[Torrubiella] hemipterigena TaxID=1531966 RepID=A0A0A1TC57_9HYPO|nr:hypothetical protein VHEMI03867 [[Torrubiella] hemipterigena]
MYADAHSRIILTEWIDSEPLTVWNSQISLDTRHSFLASLADFSIQLWTAPVEPELAVDKTSSYSAWLTNSLDRGLRRTIQGTARWGSTIDYLIMRSMVRRYSKDLDGGQILGFAHGDMNAHNVMRTKDFQLAG